MRELRALAAHQTLAMEREVLLEGDSGFRWGCSGCLPLSPSPGAVWVHLGASPFMPGGSQLSVFLFRRAVVLWLCEAMRQGRG